MEKNSLAHQNKQQKPTVTNGVTFLVCTFHKHCVTSLKTAAKETNGVLVFNISLPTQNEATVRKFLYFALKLELLE